MQLNNPSFETCHKFIHTHHTLIKHSSSSLFQMWMNVRRVLRCAMVRVCVRIPWGATSVFVDQVTGETAHTVTVIN